MSTHNQSSSRRDFLRFAGVTVAGACLFGCGSKSLTQSNQAAKPNILLITGDDLGIQVGCYGEKTVQTPNMDKLAKTGVRFQKAWVTQASCSPSRSSMHTGLYPHQNGLVGLCHRGYSMHTEYPTISSILKQQGYKTAVVGKFHIEPKSACQWDLEDRDFETHFEQRDVRNTADITEAFIDSCDNSPFFMMLNYIDPHVPLYPQKKGLPEDVLTADDVEPMPLFGINTPEIRQQTADYYNCVNRLDTGLGLIIEKLKKTGKYDNTLIIFIGDHGAPFTRSKTTCYDPGLRIPFIISYPGYTRKGLVRKELVSTIDILPTILDAVGISSPEEIPGKSLLPLAKGKNIAWREYMLGEHHTHQHIAWFPRRTVRDQRYQLVENLLPGRENPIKGVDGCVAWAASRDKSLEGTKIRAAYDRYNQPPQYELFDLKKDPYCVENLAYDPKYQKVKSRLLLALNSLRAETADPYLDPAYLDEMTAKHDKNVELHKASKQ